MGQGILTTFAMVVAEELDARLVDVDMQIQEARPENLFNQLTGGSASCSALYQPTREVCATLRARLVTAAAQRWGVPASTLTTNDTMVIAPDGRTATYGSLSAEAAAVLVPAVPTTPKDPASFTVIGKPTTRIDAATSSPAGRSSRSTSTSRGGADGRGPPADAQGTVASVDDQRRPEHAGRRRHRHHPHWRGGERRDLRRGPEGPRRPPGDVEPWAARRHVRCRRVRPPARGGPSVRRPPARPVGPRRLRLLVREPRPLEVLVAIADVRPGRAELWFPSKAPIVAQSAIAAELGLPVSAVTCHVIRAGARSAAGSSTSPPWRPRRSRRRSDGR